MTVTKNSRRASRSYAITRPSLRCYKCSTLYHYRVKRGWFLKYVLFFLPIKIYFCGHCVKNRYILLTDKGETKYNPV